MTLGKEEKLDLSRYRLRKALSPLKDAETLLKSGSYESSPKCCIKDTAILPQGLAPGDFKGVSGVVRGVHRW